MPEQIGVDDATKTILVYAQGEITEEELFNSLDKTIILHKKHGYTKILVDATKVEYMPSSVQLIMFKSKISILDRNRQLKFACILSQKAMDDFLFINKLANEQGIKMNMFQTKEEAIAWLES